MRCRCSLDAITVTRWAVALLVMLSAGTMGVQAQDPCPSPFVVANNLVPPNTRPVPVLGQLDIDGDGVPDGAPDTDGDGLPDNWEVGGADPSFVGFLAPTAIGPGTPPTFLTARLTVSTDAGRADTDDDGLTDFIEVFGLKYIDDNNNGRLDFIFTDTNGNGRWDLGEPIDPISEWLDLNLDGLPSIGEFPLANIDAALNRQHDFDGFVFTDPSNPDTDGDGIRDGCDIDPLINPETFGVPLATGFVRPFAQEDDVDLDNDGLGNGSDFGNDVIRTVDFPTDMGVLLNLFRKDRITAGTLPESLVEDLLGADWDGNGLFRITDTRGFRRPQIGTEVDAAGNDCFRQSLVDSLQPRYEELFRVGPRKLYGEFPTEDTSCDLPPSLGASTVEGTRVDAGTDYATLRQGMGYQLLVLPADRVPITFPDVRVWTILYAWRQPGFDIDGDGFVGTPEAQFQLDDRHPFVPEEVDFGFDGIITVPRQFQCGLLGALTMTSMCVGFGLLWIAGRRRFRPPLPGA